jgi:Tetratricopeptide repeat
MESKTSGAVPWAPLSGPTLVLAAIGLLFSAGFIGLALSNPTGWANASPKDEAYNLLVEGFQGGHLYLNKEVPAGLMALANPYDPEANVQFRHPPFDLHNLSYYRGRLYVYFGVVPALVLLWPWAALTGHYLFHREAAAIFCSVGFLASLGLLRGLWRRYFPQVGIPVLAALALALGLLAGSPILLQQADLCEVPIACGYALTMLGLGAVWLALHSEGRRGWWLGAASLAMGLSVGARPTLLFAAVILFIPIFRGSSRGRSWRLLPFALGPIALCGLGLMLYNYERFGSPSDFGQLYQLAVDYQGAVPHFRLGYLWFNFCVDFLEPVRWSSHFPFVGKIVPPPLPTNHGWVEDAYGVLTNLPVLCLALAAPLALRNRGEGEGRVLRGVVLAAALLFASSALVLGLFYWNASRYEMDFVPGLTLLAVIGILGLERAWAGRPARLVVSRLAWGLALGFSATFVVFNSIEHYAEERAQVGFNLQEAGQPAAAVPQFEAAIRAGYVTPEIDNFLGNDLLQENQEARAGSYYEDALRRDTNFAAAHYNFANLLGHQGRFQEAETQYRETVRLMPDNPDVHENLAVILARLGRMEEAGLEHQQALRLRSGANGR